jgi:hypothetical protein
MWNIRFARNNTVNGSCMAAEFGRLYSSLPREPESAVLCSGAILKRAGNTEILLVAMPRHALTDHGAVEDIERCEQCGRAVPDIIVGHCSGSAPPHRQARLSAVERLDL